METNKVCFEEVLQKAIQGDTDEISEIIKMYMPLINKHSIRNREIDEDLRQYIIIHIVKSIPKYKILK